MMRLIILFLYAGRVIESYIRGLNMDDLTREKILIERKVWYSFTPVLFEIVKILKNRELCFISQKGEKPKKIARYLIGFSIDYLKKHFKWINFDKFLINVYHSVAVLKPNSIPVFSYNLRVRTKQEDYKEFNKNYVNFVVGYNFFMDIDGKENFEKCYEETKEIKKIFEEYKLPYYILNSSFRGFHLIIPARFMPDYPIPELVKIIAKVVYNIKGIYDFETLDTSITDLKRVCKCPYSCVGDGSVALPLTDEQFNTFNSEMVTPKNILKNVFIKNRGLLLRTHGLSDEQLKENVNKFLSDFKE
jgi:hypothetical protein